MTLIRLREGLGRDGELWINPAEISLIENYDLGGDKWGVDVKMRNGTVHRVRNGSASTILAKIPSTP